MQKIPKVFNHINQSSGRWFLLVATLIFGASHSVTRKLQELGRKTSIDGRNPISFCNILFVGNLCALIILFAIYHKEWHWQSLTKISRKDWILMTITAVLGGALAPALIFAALNQTLVNNVILVGRIEPLIGLAIAVIVFKVKTNIWVVAGATSAFIGVICIILLQQTTGFMFGSGEFVTIIAAFSLAIAGSISKSQLTHISLGIYSVFRMLIGTLVFGAVVIILFGYMHFTDVASPSLWKWMLIYSSVIVVLGQLFWFMGIKKSSLADISLFNSFNPIAGIFGAYIILGEIPNFAQYIGGSLILLGVALGQIGASVHSRKQNLKPQTCPISLMQSGFKGI